MKTGKRESQQAARICSICGHDIGNLSHSVHADGRFTHARGQCKWPKASCQHRRTTRAATMGIDPQPVKSKI